MRVLTEIINFTLQRGCFLLIIILLFAISNDLSAQEPPPRPLEVTVDQNLAFGAFSQGAAGGSVTVTTAGSRSASGDVILLTLGNLYYAATYKLIANAGTVVSILNGSDILLSGSNGGTMSLHIGDSDPVSPFVISTVPPAFTMMNVGGTLTVGDPGTNPPGIYSGMFDITFNQE